MTRHIALTALVTMTKCPSVHLTVFLFLSDYNFSASFAPYASPDGPLGRSAAATKKISYFIDNEHKTVITLNGVRLVARMGDEL
jgi:hypothetical protein